KDLAIRIQAVFTEDETKSDKPADNDENADKEKSKLSDKSVKQYVNVCNNGTVKRTEVTTGIQNDQHIIIKSERKANQEVVTGPYSAIQNRLKDGMKVEKTTKDQLFAAPK